MKRIFLLICCLGLLCAARGQTQLHYWFDGHSETRKTIPIDNTGRLVAKLNVNDLAEGIHSVCFLAEDTAGRFSSLEQKMFMRSMSFTDELYYRCWFDNDESTAQTGELTDGAILLDVSNLADGLHTVYVQAYGNFMTPTLSHQFLKVPNVVGNEDLTYICLIDDQLYTQQTVPGTQEVIHLDLDVAPLSQGVHKLQVMLATENGAVTGAYTSYFYRAILQKEVAEARLVYMIDGKEQPAASATSATNGKLYYNLDVESLSNGLHSINYALVGANGVYGTGTTQWFYKIPLGGEGLVSYEYWLNDDEAKMHHVDFAEHVSAYHLVSLLPVEKVPVRSSLFQFAYKNDTLPVVYAKNDFHVRFWESGGSYALADAQYVDERACDTVYADTLKAKNSITAPKKDSLYWYCVQAKAGDSIAIKTNKACELQIFSPSAEEVYHADATQSVEWGGCHARENGMYYITLHDYKASSLSSITLSSNHIDRYAVLSQDVNQVGDAGYNTITFEGNGFDSLQSVDFVYGDKIIHALDIEHHSNTKVSVLLNCQEASHGIYDAIFYFPNEDLYREESLTIEQALDIELSTDLDYNPTYLMGDLATFSYTITNNGNMTAYGLPISIELYSDTGEIENIYLEGIEVPSLYESTIDALERESVALSTDDRDEIYDVLKNYKSSNHIFYITTVTRAKPRHTTVILTRIPPMSKRTFTVNIKGTGKLTGRFTSHNGNFPSVQGGDYVDFKDDGGEGTNGGSGSGTGSGSGSGTGSGSGGTGSSSGSGSVGQRPSWFCCHHKNIENGLNGLSFIPGIGCVTNIAAYVSSEFAGLACDNVQPPTLRDRAVSWLGIGLACSGAKGVAGAWAYFGSGLASGYAMATGNNYDPDCDDPDQGESDPVDPSDPNDIRGYTSESGSRYMRSDIETIHYEIEYENDTAVATAPAHTIIVRDTLDASRFDLTSFAATEITIGDRKMKWETPQGGTQTLDMRTRMNVIAQVQLDYNDQTGIAQWTITSLDPMTMEPITEPDLGVLPVNFDGNGMGTISYRINLKNHFADGTKISNRASIIFDNNEPILTPVWINTVDAVKPASEIKSSMLAGDSITFCMKTSDNRSGVWRRDVYARVSAEEGWQIAAQSHTDTAVVKLTDGWRQFYILAVDSAGNVETKTANPEYSLVLDTYLITFYDEDGITVLDAREWDYGVIPECEEPTKAADDTYSYLFNEWVPAIAPVTEETSYRATYKTMPLIVTSIKETTKDIPSAQKMIKDGQLLILRGGKIYSTTGQEIR